MDQPDFFCLVKYCQSFFLCYKRKDRRISRCRSGIEYQLDMQWKCTFSGSLQILLFPADAIPYPEGVA
jgi:hypothetical protein